VTNDRYAAEGMVASTDPNGSWRAGLNGALPGLQMHADPRAGFAFQQQRAPAHKALDMGEIMTTDGTGTGLTGSHDHVPAVSEASTAKPDLRDIKYRSPGVGLIGEDEAVDANRAKPQAFRP